MRKLLKVLLALAIGVLAPTAIAQETFVEGLDYVVLDERAPVTAPPEMIEVKYFFLTRCEHCFTFEPRYQIWAAKQADDIELQRTHMHEAFLPIHARGYYVAEELGVAKGALWLAYDAIHAQKNYLETEEDWVGLFALLGISADDALMSFGAEAVDTHLLQADEVATSYRARSVPYLVIDGRYGISPSAKGESVHERMLATADFLIAKVREEREGL